MVCSRRSPRATRAGRAGPARRRPRWPGWTGPSPAGSPADRGHRRQHRTERELQQPERGGRAAGGLLLAGQGQRGAVREDQPERADPAGTAVAAPPTPRRAAAQCLIGGGAGAQRAIRPMTKSAMVRTNRTVITGPEAGATARQGPDTGRGERSGATAVMPERRHGWPGVTDGRPVFHDSDEGARSVHGPDRAAPGRHHRTSSRRRGQRRQLVAARRRRSGRRHPPARRPGDPRRLPDLRAAQYGRVCPPARPSPPPPAGCRPAGSSTPSARSTPRPRTVRRCSPPATGSRSGSPTSWARGRSRSRPLHRHLRWPMDDAARIAVETVRDTPDRVREARFVLFTTRCWPPSAEWDRRVERS